MNAPSHLHLYLEQVSPDPEIPFPHAAMVTPPVASTPWLQPLTSALSSLVPTAMGNNGAKNEKNKKRKKKRRLDTSGTRTETSTVACGVDVAPHFVTPVWESCSKILDTSQSGRATTKTGNRQHLHLADAQLFARGEDGNGEWSLIVCAPRT